MEQEDAEDLPPLAARILPATIREVSFGRRRLREQHATPLLSSSQQLRSASGGKGRGNGCRTASGGTGWRRLAWGKEWAYSE